MSARLVTNSRTESEYTAVQCTMPSRFENSLILGYGALDQPSPVRSVVAFCHGTLGHLIE